MKSRNASLALLAVTTLVVAACSSGGGYGDDRDDPMPPAANTPPAISAISAKSASQDTVVGPFSFDVQDDSTPSNMLDITVTADGTSLFPADGVVLGGSGGTRNLTLTPLEAATGTATFTVRAADAQGAVATRSFDVTVSPRGASMREWALTTFAKAEADAPTTVNGYTFTQDADDTTIFDPLIGEE